MSQKAIGTRADYHWFTSMPTRWMDNDVFGHVNNVVYYSWVDTAVAEFLLQAGMYGIMREVEKERPPLVRRHEFACRPCIPFCCRL